MHGQKFYDVPGGDTVLLEIVDEETGYRQPVFPFLPEPRTEHFKSIADIECRPDDIFLNSYPKTGTNWMWEMVHLALNKTSTVSGGGKFDQMIEAVAKDSLDAAPSPRLLNTHLKPRYLPKDAVTKAIKTILICRNPKDVVVSFYNHTKGIGVYDYDGKFENYLEMFMRGDTDYGSYAQYLLEWQQYIRDHPDLPVHIVYYEDLKQNCYEEMKKVVQFLGLDLSDELVKDIVDNCHMSKIKDNKIKAMDPEVIEMYKKSMKGDFTVFRKGQIGDWKNWFTEEQSAKFDAWWSTETKDLDMFKFVYE